MFEAHSINAEHKDLIHDIAYDFYGQRMATCSSDQYVKVWDEDEHGNWHLSASWKAHSGSVWKVTWAHPEFGQVLATCSFDRTAAVWEEIVGEGSGPGERGMRHWVRRTNLVDSRKSVTDVKFAPKTLGLLLATCSEDGVIRIYEAPDVMNLSQWTLQHDISCKLQCSCLSWNPSLSRLHHPMIAVGSDDPNPSSEGKVFIYEYSESSRRWTKTQTLNIIDPIHDIAFAPNLGRSFHTLAIASKDVQIIILKPMVDNAQSGSSRFEINVAAQFSDHDFTVWRVCWNIMGTILASSGDDGCVRLWKDNYINNWKCVAVLKGDGTSAQSAETSTVATPPNHSTGIQQTSSTTRAVTIATVTTEKPTVTVMCSNKWQAPVIKGRFSKSVWLGNPSEPTPPPPPILEYPKAKK
ncbi:nucleoporin SEH1 isoform X1 [Bombus affinis]|uniref:Nucleoporin SEH1 isoform X1 n=1 Tax=Bombus terrestris TaxID=30195 RepID=A0A6P3D9F2_BOMTE|nr:nucleoporin SEH1 isoform X1 [Bombus terrestris]XP_012163836.1 nucleoporin SEH1 isoform X1 [Bombus terrestris]XP_020718961.1 nucleoporin SEH1 isoform X1 [Bombus terrestris]XP_050590325.1 nucleoporin SEH1 isoform X1 [Bombus affinis]XP_050590326.1 nucleoporin SEH1 isoform X1 [Bombus affinis]